MLLNGRFKTRHLFMKFPAVGEEDVVNGGGLPPELQGKTANEIATYYAERESTILANARTMVTEAREGRGIQTPAPPPPGNPPTPKPSDMVTREELNNITGAAQAGLVQIAQMTAAQGKDDWGRLLPEIRKIVEQLPPLQQVNSEIWAEAYYNVRGRMTDTLVTEARNRALGLEPPSPPPPAPAKARTFTEGELSVIEGCGITTEMYADAENKLASGYQPFTTDNRRGRK